MNPRIQAVRGQYRLLNRVFQTVRFWNITESFVFAPSLLKMVQSHQGVHSRFLSTEAPCR